MDPLFAEERERLKSTFHTVSLVYPLSELSLRPQYLASEDADFTTGVTLPLDGGWLAYGYQTT